MANLEENLRISSLYINYGHNIPVLLGIKNYSIWASRMHFSLGRLPVLAFIETHLLWIINNNFSVTNMRFTGQTLSLMISKMGDATMVFANRAKTVNKLCSYLYLQYHEKRWEAESILFQKLVQIQHSDCERTGDYLGKFCRLSQQLANMGQVCKNWWLIYLLFSSLDYKYTS